MYFDTRDTTKTPWIINTVTGKLFSNVPGGGIEIENGLIKNWDMSAITGDITIPIEGGKKLILTCGSGLIVSAKYE